MVSWIVIPMGQFSYSAVSYSTSPGYACHWPLHEAAASEASTPAIHEVVLLLLATFKHRVQRDRYSH